MFKKLFYLISIVALMAVSTQVQADVIFSDDFDHAMMDDWSRINYQGWYEQEVLGWPSPGGPWAIGDWDGYQSLPDDSGASPTLIAHPVINAVGNVMWGDPCDPNAPQTWRPGYEGPVLNGVLRIASTNGAWEHDRNSGAFLYKMVEGDFVAEVEVVAYDVFWHHLGSLMARVPNEGGAGADELWTQLNCFPLYGIGNRVMDKTGPGDSSATGVKGYPADRYLRLERVGNTFFYYTSPDGETWASLPGVEEGIVRDDMPAELQVGISQSNFTGDWLVNMDFDNFSIETASESEVVAHWPLDEGAGTVVADVVGGNDGEIVGNVAWIADGGVSFDGTAGNHVAVPNAEAIEFGDEDFTVSLWIRYPIGVDPLGRTEKFIVKGTNDAPGTGSRYEVFLDNSGDIRFTIDNGPDNKKSRVEQPAASVLTGEWAHLVGVRDAANDLMSLYVDGVLLGTATDSSGDISNGEPMFIGEAPYGGDSMSGDIKDVRIFNAALTEDQIGEI